MISSVRGMVADAGMELLRRARAAARAEQLAVAGGGGPAGAHIMFASGGTGAGANGRLRIDLESRSPGEASLRLSGELDMVTAPQLRDELARHRGRGRRVVLDLSGVEFIDSTGLVLLMESARERSSDGWALALRRNLSPAVARLFEVTRSEPLFDWVDGA